MATIESVDRVPTDKPEFDSRLVELGRRLIRKYPKASTGTLWQSLATFRETLESGDSKEITLRTQVIMDVMMLEDVTGVASLNGMEKCGSLLLKAAD